MAVVGQIGRVVSDKYPKVFRLLLRMWEIWMQSLTQLQPVCVCVCVCPPLPPYFKNKNRPTATNVTVT